MSLAFGPDIDDLEPTFPLIADGGGDAQPDPLSRRGQDQWSVREVAADGEPPVVKRLPENVEQSARYHARTPEPNYSQFQAEYVDSKGREYAFARRGAFLAAQGDDVDNSRFGGVPPRSGSVKVKRLLLFLRMPISHRWQVPLPTPVGEKLELYHVATQVLCEAKTDGVFVASPRGRTGHVFVNDFESMGQVADPMPYEPWLRISEEPGGERF